MAIDSAAKRSSIVGVGRPYLRGQTVDTAKGEPWRHSVGNTYAAFNFGPVVAAAAKWFPFMCNIRRRRA
jgi:hypothetical protein